MAEGTLNVIALVSGGKDSFFSILHCLANGHRVVALANLYPQSPSTTTSTSPAAATTIREPSHDTPSQPQQQVEEEDEADLNSFMYQTVGHQVIPLYAQAIGLTLFRHPIVGTAVHHGLSYQAPQERRESPSKIVAATKAAGDEPTTATTTTTRQGPRQEGAEGEGEGEDETESLVPLLRAVLVAHPEANALSTGAILSTYQRTRVESVALRLGLAPLSYLWQYPELPLPLSGGGANDETGKAGRTTAITTITSRRTGQQQEKQQQQQQQQQQQRRNSHRDDSQLLRDMAAAGLDARIVKVASAGLDDSFLWENVASEAGARRVERGLRRFGGGGGRGSVLGEGGEFETLVVDGPPSLFRGGRIVVREESRRVVREGGGSVWLSICDAAVDARGDEEAAGAKEEEPGVRIPGLLDPRFEATLGALVGESQQTGDDAAQLEDVIQLKLPPLGQAALSDYAQQWCFVGREGDGKHQAGVEGQTARVVADIQRQLQRQALPASAITNAIIVLRRMSDFPTINKLYGSLFEEPNPPARVTISCGDALPRGCEIAVYLTVHNNNDNPSVRRGLHVQSRSYWAPANIGPYSQAISVPLLPPPPSPPTKLPSSSRDDGDDDNDDDVGGSYHQAQPYSADANLAVSIAGQIPLVPASMALPGDDIGDDDSLVLQITLALQHLWRVAVAVDVQWWTSAAAYFPRTSSRADMQRAAALAAAAWCSAHLWTPEEGAEDEDEDGPDIWDRRFNSAFQSFGDDQADRAPAVPDWEVVKGFGGVGDDDDDEGKNIIEEKKRRRVPFFFAAEVDELPRQAGIEWHAHLGLAKVRPGSVQVFSRSGVRSPSVPSRALALHHVVVETPSGVFIQSAAALPWKDPGESHEKEDLEAAILDVRREVVGSSAAAASTAGGSRSSLFDDATSLHLVYIDVEAFPASTSLPLAIIPCRSLWDSRGDRVGLVALFQNRLSNTK